MKKWIDNLKNVSGSFAIIMLNNHFAGFAPESVNQFRKLMGFDELSFADKKQKTLSNF